MTMASHQNTTKTYTLNTGAKIPAVGLGTWQSKPNEVRHAVEWALARGYRHIDTAAAYGNEKEVGDGIKGSGVPRDQIWLTTKLNNPDHQRAAAALDDSLAKLGTDYVDLYLMHWPASVDPRDRSRHLAGWDFVDTWKEMQKLLATGKVRNIGVSNVSVTNMKKLLADPGVTVVPAVNQVEIHPGNPSPKLIAFNTSHGIHTTAYSSLGSTRSPFYSDKTLLSIARAKGHTPQQVLLLWGLSRGVSILPKSVTKQRIDDNFDLDGWALTDEEVRQISAIPHRFKVCTDGWLPVTVFHGDDE